MPRKTVSRGSLLSHAVRVCRQNLNTVHGRECVMHINGPFKFQANKV